MFKLDIQISAGEWSDDAPDVVEMPRPFMLVGQGGPNVLGGQNADRAWVVDAEGVMLRSGATYAWCRSGCCAQPRYWPSVEAAADFHGSMILDTEGAVRGPHDGAPENGTAGRVVPGSVVPGGGPSASDEANGVPPVGPDAA